MTNISNSLPTFFRLDGRVALVTGASKGLGRAIALRLAAMGAHVAVNYLTSSVAATEVVASIRSSGGTAQDFRADVTDSKEINELVSRIGGSLGPIDILVINATCSHWQSPIEDYDLSFLERMIDYFVRSPFWLIQSCLPQMKERRWGRIINIGSEVFQRGTELFSAYVAAKGAQAGLTRSLAKELIPFGVTVNQVSPGMIPVERHREIQDADKHAYFLQIPAKRWGEPDDVASAVQFFASNEAGFITGQTLCVSGGMFVQ